MLTAEMIWTRGAVAGLAVALAASGCTTATSQSRTENAMRQRAHAALIEVLERDEKFIKVHAAELLIARGEKERVREIFKRELEVQGNVPGYRVGIWRVLAGAAANDTERAAWIARITVAFLDQNGPDRIHAIESLGKLGHRVDGAVLRAATVMAETAPAPEGMFAWWVLHLSGDTRALNRITAALASREDVARSRAAYIIWWQKLRDASTLSALARAADSESSETVGRAIIVAGALALDANPSRAATWWSAINTILQRGSPGERYQACLLLREKFSTADLPRLTPLLDHENGDVRVGAAAAILAVVERNTPRR
jgi:SSS family solute:Na+ symporter